MNEKEQLNQFLHQLDDEVKVEIKTYHATKKDIWITNQSSNENTVCAKSIKYLDTGATRYYVKRCACEFYDNTHISQIYTRKLWKIAPVSEEAFKLYIAFLGFADEKSKGRIMLKTKAERLV